LTVSIKAVFEMSEAISRARSPSVTAKEPVVRRSGDGGCNGPEGTSSFLALTFAASVALTMWAPSVITWRRVASGQDRLGRQRSIRIDAGWKPGDGTGWRSVELSSSDDVAVHQQSLGEEGFLMKKTGFALIAAGVLALACIASPRPAEAWRGRVGPGLAGGLVAGAVLGGLAASSAYAWAPGYGYDYDYYGPSYGPWPGSSYNGSGCPARGYGKYYNCGRYAVPGYPRY
jgi:hypothetical protein